MKTGTCGFLNKHVRICLSHVQPMLVDLISVNPEWDKTTALSIMFYLT